MKKLALIVCIAALFTGCSTTQPTEKASESIADQQLTTTFTRNNVKVEWSCKWFSGITQATCIKGNVTAIEATGYAPSYGNSEAMRETAFAVAHDVALDKLVRFIKQDLTSSRVTSTLSKNIEKAEDQYTKTGKKELVSETDASSVVKSDRSNSNESVRSVVESIRTQANGIIRGAQVTEEKIVDRQTVAVTVRWSVGMANGAKSLQSYFK